MYYKCNTCGYECTEQEIKLIESRTEFDYYICPMCDSREIYEDYDKEKQGEALEKIIISLKALAKEIDRDLYKSDFRIYSYETTLQKLIDELGRVE